MARPSYGGRPTCEGCKSIDVRRWHREGRHVVDVLEVTSGVSVIVVLLLSTIRSFRTKIALPFSVPTYRTNAAGCVAAAGLLPADIPACAPNAPCRSSFRGKRLARDSKQRALRRLSIKVRFLALATQSKGE
jgi:hypothetical protein